jgi:hypothetical protein
MCRRPEMGSGPRRLARQREGQAPPGPVTGGCRNPTFRPKAGVRAEHFRGATRDSAPIQDGVSARMLGKRTGITVGVAAVAIGLGFGWTSAPGLADFASAPASSSQAMTAWSLPVPSGAGAVAA